MSVAYCPWCGEEIIKLSVFHSGEIEWNFCKTPRCKGNFFTITTDSNGFVIHPNHIRGRYVFAKPTNLNGGQNGYTKNDGRNRRH